MGTVAHIREWAKAPIRLLIVSLLVGGGVLLFVRVVWPVRVDARSPANRARAINLALRRTAHQLLRTVGDSTSRIPPVVQLNTQTFRVQLGRALAYDQLPSLLETSFRLHRVAGTYDVAVLNCATNNLELGYTVDDLTKQNSVPCGGRSVGAGCYSLEVQFRDETPLTQPSGLWMLGAVGVLVLGLGLVVWYRPKPGNVLENSTPHSPGQLVMIGRSELDLPGQLLTVAGIQHKLTYRETKLLSLLANHPNQVLERDRILKLVWEDEGITVGRSIDVFVSRLRKLLAADPLVRIAAVHGIGYRLLISEASSNIPPVG